MKYKHGPNNYIEIDADTMAIEICSKGEKFLCLFDREDYPRVKNFRWSITSETKRNKTRYLRTHPLRVGPSEGWVLIFHQLIMSFPVDGQIDHINHNGLDNRKRNLRVVRKIDNARNKHYITKAKSGFYGVVPNNSRAKPWKVYISHGKKPIYLGSFENIEDAARAHDKKSIELRGEFAILNFPHDQTNSM
jgi:hypothetical protein